MKLAALTIAATFSVAVVAPAAYAENGDRRNCVTRGEYRQIHDGATKRHVQRIFDSPGALVTADGGDITRAWKACTDKSWRNVYVDFDRRSDPRPGLRVWYKAWFA